MDKHTTVDQVVFYCNICVNTTEGTAEDTLMFSNIKVTNDNDMFNSFKKHAAVDPCNAKKMIPCPKCRMPYMSIIRIGAQDRGYLICRCGYEELYK